MTERYLCVCDGGNVRSAALAFVLKWELKQEAIAAGRLHLSPDTMAMLCDWASLIVLMQPHMIESIPEQFHAKVRVIDVGEDRFGVYVHPDLLPMVREGAQWLLNGCKQPTPA